MSPVKDGVKHWSGAFVEHLRAVHLALVTVSVGLILVAFSSRPYDPQKALTEVRQILQLGKDWSPEWVRLNLRTNVVVTAAGKDHDQEFAILVGQPFTCGLTGPDKHERAFTCIAKQTWSESRHRFMRENRSRNGRVLPVVSVTSFPSTVWQFRTWWWWLSQPQRFDFAHLISEGTAKGPNRNEQWVYYDDQVKAKPTGQPVELSPDIGEKDGSYSGKLDNGKTTVELPVDVIELCEVTQGLLQERLFPNWRKGSFDESFPELAKAVGSFDEVSLQDMATRLEQETGKGEESFEAFGLKVPVAQLTNWGTVLLLSIQLYFYVHLKELSRKLGEDDPGWDVPWIGMYQSHLSRLILLVSSCIAPILAVGLLGWYSSAPYVHDKVWRDWRAHKWELMRLFISALAVLISILLSWHSWKYRPKVVLTGDEVKENVEREAENL